MSDIGNISEYFNLDGKVALITGGMYLFHPLYCPTRLNHTGSRGLGLHTATVYLKAGCRKVIISARKAEGPEGINQAVEKLNKIPGIKGVAIGMPANSADTKDIERLVKEVQKTEQKINILVANAGATYGGPFDDAPDSFSSKILDLNVRGVFNLIRLYVSAVFSFLVSKNTCCGHSANPRVWNSFTPLLTAGGTPTDPSRVIIVSSVAGTHVPHTGKNGTIMYSVSKAAAHHLSRNLAVELGPRNITVNTVAPGFFPSKLASGLIGILGGEDELKKNNPRSRLGVPQDMAAVMLFLASPASNYLYVFIVVWPLERKSCTNYAITEMVWIFRLMVGLDWSKAN